MAPAQGVDVRLKPEPEVAAMQRLCRITVPGLSARRDLAAVRERLLAEFPNVEEVLATTNPGTLLVLTSGSPDEAEAWLNAVSDTLATTRALARWRGRLDGHDSAA
jgi:hypothetical protein